MDQLVVVWSTGEVGKLQAAFAQRGVKLLALSCNDVESHRGYAKIPDHQVCHGQNISATKSPCLNPAVCGLQVDQGH